MREKCPGSPSVRKGGYAVKGLEGIMRLLAMGFLTHAFLQLINLLPALAGAFLFLNERLLLLTIMSAW